MCFRKRIQKCAQPDKDVSCKAVGEKVRNIKTFVNYFSVISVTVKNSFIRVMKITSFKLYNLIIMNLWTT